MEITKRGTVKSERVWIGICRKCGSEAKASERELKNITHDHREGDFFSWEKCPVCEAGGISEYNEMLFYPEKKA